MLTVEEGACSSWSPEDMAEVLKEPKVRRLEMLRGCWSKGLRGRILVQGDLLISILFSAPAPGRRLDTHQKWAGNHWATARMGTEASSCILSSPSGSWNSLHSAAGQMTSPHLSLMTLLMLSSIFPVSLHSILFSQPRFLLLEEGTDFQTHLPSLSAPLGASCQT